MTAVNGDKGRQRQSEDCSGNSLQGLTKAHASFCGVFGPTDVEPFYKTSWFFDLPSTAQSPHPL